MSTKLINLDKVYAMAKAIQAAERMATFTIAGPTTRYTEMAQNLSDKALQELKEYLQIHEEEIPTTKSDT